MYPVPPFEQGMIQLLEKLRTAKRVLVVSDGRPDGDSIGSSTATLGWLKRDYPHLHVRAFCRKRIPPSLLCMSHVMLFTTDMAIFREPWDLILMHDAGDLAHGGVEEAIPHTPLGYTLVNIDHHSTNARYGEINIVHTDACSTTEVLYRCFLQQKIRVDAEMASSLLAGLLTDTSSFMNSGTTAGSLAMAAELIRCGARYEEIYASTISHQSLESLKLFGKAFTRLHKHEAWDMAVTHVFADEHETLADEEAMSGLSNTLYLYTADAEVVMVLKDSSEGLVKGSVRSSERDISQFCRALGGGGHKKAAGFAVSGRLRAKEDGSAEIVPVSSH